MGFETVQPSTQTHIAFQRLHFWPAVLVTAVAFVEGRFVEVDAVHITKELLVLPRGRQRTVSQLDYFCSTTSGASKPGMYCIA